MDDTLQHHVIARIENDELTGDETVVLRVSGTERISQLFELEIHCVGAIGTAAPVAGEDLLNKSTSLVFYQGDTELRRIAGTVSRVRDHAEQGIDRPHTILTFVPRAYPAAHFETLDVFLDQAVPNIVESVLTRSRLTAGSDFDIADLTGRSAASEGENGSKDYACIEYTVQYKESNLAFVQRLCEHLGIFYFFDAEGMMVFSDSNDAFEELERPEVPYISHDTGTWTERVRTLQLTTRNLPARYVMRDYNWRNPGVDMMGQADVIADGVGQIVEYGGHFKTPEQGTGMAEIRAEELRATRYVYDGTSTAPSFAAGGTFMLTGHPFGDIELLLTEVVHEYEGGDYSNSFKAILRDTAYRPPRLTPKPRVDGSLTGMVQGGSGTEFGEIDGQGRYRVKFMFDTAERGEGQASRAVRMAQPSAGGAQGFSFPLRAGVEVILTCIDGDPDRPIITGAVPNPSQMSPTTGNNPNHNMIKTSKNQIDIDDDQARIKLTTDGHGTQLQLGTPNEPNEGYHLKTMADGVGSAGKLIGSTSPLISTLADYRQSMANQNIIAAAGPPNPLSAFAKFTKFAGAVIDFSSGALGVADAAMDFVKTNADNVAAMGTANTNTAKDAVIDSALGAGSSKYDKDAAKKTVTAADGTVLPVTETEDQYRNRMYGQAMAKRKEDGRDAAARNDPAADGLLADPPTSVAEGDNLMNIPFTDYYVSGDAAQSVSDAMKGAGENKWYAGAKAIVGTAQGIKDTTKKLKDLKKALAGAGGLWGSAIDLNAKAQKAAEYISAVKWVGAFNVVAGNTERKRHTGAPPAQPYHILGASNSTVVYGNRNAYVFSMSTGVYGSKAASLKSAKLVQVSSKNIMELATKDLYVSVAQNMNTKVAGKLASKVTKVAAYVYDDTLRTVVKKDVHLESKEKKINVKAVTGYILDGGDKIDGKAKQIKWKASEKSFVVDAEKDFWVKSKADAKINADKHALAHGKTKFTGKSDKGGIEATSSKTKIWQQSSTVTMESSKINVKSTKIDVIGSSTVLLKGGGGKVLLKGGKAHLC